MSGHHHKRVGWTYGPRPRGTCTGCKIGRTLTKAGLVVSHRERVNGSAGPRMCSGSLRPPEGAQPFPPEQPPSDVGPDPVRPYRDLLRALIEADVPCQSPLCGVTTLGHLLTNVSPELVNLVRAEDPEERPR